jgi:Tol biopolymer transport system component
MKTPDVAPTSWVDEGGVIMKKRIASLLLLVVSLMNPRRQRQFCCVVMAAALSLGASGIVTAQQCLVSTIAFISNRDHPHDVPPKFRSNASDFEIYLMNPDGTNVRRLTENTDGDAFPAFSPDGKRIVFDSNRNNALEDPPQVPLNIGDLFLMKDDGSPQKLLTRGTSASWSPDGKSITFHRSASGLACPVSAPPPFPGIPGCPISTDPGAATWDSDIFIARVGDLLDNVAEPTNITNSPEIDDDPDWSPDGKHIAFIRHPVNPVANSAELYVLNLETGALQQLTDNLEEEEAPAWSPDGTRIAYACRIGGGTNDFEICVINADGTNRVPLTDNTFFDGAPTWSPDGQKIVFERGQKLWIMNADGTGQALLTSDPQEFPGFYFFPKWGMVRTNCD